MNRVAATSALAVLGLAPVGAFAANLNLFAGENLGSNETGLAVAELALPMIAEVGPFVEWSRNSSLPEDRYIGGLVARMTLPFLNFFVDTRAGYNWNAGPIDLSARNGFNLEFGVGYRFTGQTVDIMPRLGISAVTANSDIPDTNISLGVAIVL